MELVERDSQIREVDRLRSEAWEGKGQVVLLDGPAASGKTELLRSCSQRATDADFLVLNAACSAAERTLPFAVLGQLLRHANVPSQVADPLNRLLSCSGEDADKIGSTLDEVPQRILQMFHELCLALINLSVERPIFIAIDDVRDADIPTQQFLRHLIRRMAPAHMLLVLTESTSLTPAHRAFGDALLREPRFHQVELGPLSQDGVQTLVAEQFGNARAHRLTPELFRLSGGNPLLLLALLKDLDTPDNARRHGYGRALLSCLHRSDEVMLTVAKGLAVLKDGASPAELAQLTGLDARTVGQALLVLATAGIHDEEGFRHPDARATVAESMSAEDRAALHERAAELQHHNGAAAAAVAGHLIRAGTVGAPWAVSVLLEAAAHALLGDQTTSAVDYLEFAHHISADGPERGSVLAKLVHAEWRLNPSAAAPRLASLTRAARAGQLEGSELIGLIRQLLWFGRVGEANDVLAQLRDAAVEQHTEAARELVATELWLAAAYPLLTRRSQLPMALALAKQTTMVTPSNDPWLQSTATMADVFTRGRSRESVDQAQRVLRDLRLSRNTSWAEESAILAMLTLLCADENDLAADWCRRLSTEAPGCQTPAWRALFATVRAEAALRQGDLQSGAALARTAMTDLPPRAWGVAVGLPLGTLIIATTRMGDYDDAAKLLTQAVPESFFQSRHGLHYLHARGQYHLATNHCHAALADFQSCGELLRNWGLDLAGIVPWRASSAEAWLQLGNHEQANKLIYDQLARQGADASRTRALSLRLLAATSPLRRRPQILTEALELFETCGDRYEQGRVLTDLSRAYYALDDRRRARTVFRRAWHLLKMCDAAPLYQELLAIGGDLGGVVPVSEGSDGLSALTDSERRVASLAVMGYTNREIAARLYVTTSTVEQHLTRVYRKAGIRHRRDLPVSLLTGTAKSDRQRQIS